MALTLLDGVRRQSGYWTTLYRRTWRGSVVSSFASPLFYALSMGVLLGGYIQGDPDQLEGATSYLAFIVPGLIAAQAMQIAMGEVTYPLMAMMKWQRIHDSQLATPLEPRHLVAAHLVFVGARVLTSCTVFTVVLAPFGVYASWWGPLLAIPVQVLVGLAFAAPVYALSTRLQNESGFGLIYRLGVFPMFLFSGAFFPVENLGRLGAWVARATPLWQGVNLSRMLMIDQITVWIAVVNVAVLVGLVLVGWRFAVSGLTRRLVS